MESQYDIKAWAGETTVGRRIFNYNFRMLGREFSGWQLLKSVQMHKDRSLSEMTYLWQRKDAPEQQLVSVNVAELPDWRAAHRHLHRMLEHTMRPDLPRGNSSLLAVGDIEFVAREPQSDVPAAVQFTRGNLVVAVSSVGSVTVDVSETAAIVDKILSTPPTKVPSLRPLARLRAPRAVQARARVGASLVKNLKKIGDTWLNVTVPDGEVKRSGDALVYLTPRPGKKSVQIVSVRTGTKRGD